MDRRHASALLLATLAGCAGQTRPYPSLAPRAVEKQGFGEPAVAPVAITADVALDADVAKQGADLDRVVAGFTAAAAKADASAKAAAHQAVGSDAWLRAQGDLATLDGWRSQASALTAAIEATASARAARLAPPYPTLDALAARAGAEVDRESAAAARLRDMIPAA